MHKQSSRGDEFKVRRDMMSVNSRGWASTALLKRVLPGVLLAAAVALPTMALAKTKTITAVMHSDLRVIDPLLTTAYITRDHGYMVYDTLVATDANFKVQPQMADWT